MATPLVSSIDGLLAQQRLRCPGLDSRRHSPLIRTYADIHLRRHMCITRPLQHSALKPSFRWRRRPQSMSTGHFSGRDTSAWLHNAKWSLNGHTWTYAPGARNQEVRGLASRHRPLALTQCSRRSRPLNGESCRERFSDRLGGRLGGIFASQPPWPCIVAALGTRGLVGFAADRRRA